MIKRGEIHMSRKNHQMVNGQLLQMDKQYSALKQKQKEKIALWMYEETYAYYLQYHKMPMSHRCEIVIDKVYERIQDAEIWIPYGEVYRYYIKRKTKIIHRIEKKLNQSDQSE